MENALTQGEVDALVQAAMDCQNPGNTVLRTVRPCTFRKSGQLTEEQLAAVNRLHETFARNVTQTLGAYLRVAVEVKLVSAEQLAYSEFLNKIPQITYMMCFAVEEMKAEAAMQMDHSLVFPLVDILLGGDGQCEAPARDITEIEEHIMDAVVKMICRELELAWGSVGTALSPGRRPSPAQLQTFLPPTEKTLCLSFSMRLVETTGTFMLVFPAAISTTLLRRLSVDPASSRSRADAKVSGDLTAKMLDCQFAAHLEVPAIQLPVSSLVTLAPQKLYNLGISVRQPASLVIAGHEAFEANPVRQGRRRAAQLGRQLAISEEEGKL
jgi:flagellar motor switch protein FliM